MVLPPSLTQYKELPFNALRYPDPLLLVRDTLVVEVNATTVDTTARISL
jgi:hypothetical protein